MNDQSKMTLSASQRSALRKAITANSGWRDFSTEWSLKIDGMSVTQLLNCANELGISPDSYMTAVESAAASYGESSRPMMEARREMHAVESEQREFDRKHGPFPAAQTDAAQSLASLIGQIAGQSMSPDAIRATVNEAIDARQDHPLIVATMALGWLAFMLWVVWPVIVQMAVLGVP